MMCGSFVHNIGIPEVYNVVSEKNGSPHVYVLGIICSLLLYRTGVEVSVHVGVKASAIALMGLTSRTPARKPQNYTLRETSKGQHRS